MEEVKISKNSLEKLLHEYLNDKEQIELRKKMFDLIHNWEYKEKKEIESAMAEVLRGYLPYISNMKKLKYYWDHSSAGSESRKLLESRIAEILANIRGAEEWLYFWENVPCDSLTGNMSDSERAEMLRGHLSNTDDMSELVCFRESVHYWGGDSLQKKLINDRMVEVLTVQLPSIDDIGELVRLWSGVGFDSELKELINDRIAEVLTVQLPCIDDMNKLIFFNGKVWPVRGFPRNLRGLVECRMAQVLPDQLPNINDIEKLILFWSNTSTNSKPKELIEDRMAEVLPDQLPNINDMRELKRLWENTSVDSKPREMTEDRMVKVLEGVKLENTPSWFVDILKEKFFLPDFLKEYFLKKVKSLTERN